LGIDEIFGAVEVPALAVATPIVMPIIPAKTAANKTFKIFERVAIKAAPFRGHIQPPFLRTLHFLRCGLCQKSNLDTLPAKHLQPQR
jgi:hypothetical protein